MSTLLAVHCASTWALVGLIWTVQLVHYPLFATVGYDRFRAYHACHTRTITWIVGPLMLAELATAILLVVGGAREPWLLVSLPPLLFNWLSTGLVQVPLHNRLATGFNPDAHRRLVATNWWRTLAWTFRGACLLYGVS
jgi:hypothetical protein